MISIIAVAVLAASPIRLEEAREQSRKNVRALHAELDRLRAVEQVNVARSQLLPRVTLSTRASGELAGPKREYLPLDEPSGGVQYQVVDVASSGGGIFDFNVTVSQLLYDAGRWAQLAQAGASAEAAAGQAFEERTASEYEGVRRFYVLLRAQRALEVLEQKARSSQAQLDRTRALFEAGRRRKEDVLAASVNLGNDRIQILQQRAQMTAAQADLAAWLARPGAEPLEAVDPGTLVEQIPAPPSFEQAYQVARERRPLLGAHAAQVRAAEEGVRAVRADFLPRLSLQAGYSRRSPAPDLFIDLTRQNTVSGSLSLSWDLFSGLATSAQIREAEHARRRAELSLEQAERDVAAEVRKALEVLAVQTEVAAVARENLTLAQEGLRLAEERFAAGVATSLEVRDAQVKLTDAELSLLGSRVDVEVARAALERAMGILTPGGAQ